MSTSPHAPHEGDAGGHHDEPARARRAAGVLGKAVRGAFWMVLSGTGARALGIIGTLAITRYLHPEEYGEVSLAALVLQIANLLSNGGLSQYITSRPKASRDVVFHATFFYMALGLVALALTLLFGDFIGRSLHAPGIVRYLPGFTLAAILDRLTVIMDRVQLRDMRFRSVGVQRSLGELTYSGVSLGLAMFAAGTPYGGANALVWGALARGLVRVITLSATTARRDWLSPCRLDRAVTRDIFAFGVPMAVVTVAGFGAQKFDNVVFQFHFGLAWLTFYNLAYNFADMPASLIGEQIGDVLVPSFAQLQDDERRRQALLLSLRVMILLVTPLAVGLALVAPTLSKLAFDPRYQEGIIKVLRILAMFSVARTITWVANSYLQVRNQPRTIMILETARMLGIIVFMNVFVIAGRHFGTHDLFALFGLPFGSPGGPSTAVKAACLSVVFVFTMSAVSYLWVIRKLDRVPLRDLVLPLLPPGLAVVPMMVAVWGTRQAVSRLGWFVLDHVPVTLAEHARVFGPRLALEVLAGAVVFACSALVLSPRSARELLGLVRDAGRRRRGGDAHDEGAAAAAPAGGP